MKWSGRVVPVFQSAWARWPPQSAWVWTGTCWVWTGSPAPGAADWWRPCGASGTSPADRTEGPLEEEEEQSHQSGAKCLWTGHSLFMTNLIFQRSNTQCLNPFGHIYLRFKPLKILEHLIYHIPRTWRVQYNFVGGNRRTYVRSLWSTLTITALLQFIVEGGAAAAGTGAIKTQACH